MGLVSLTIILLCLVITRVVPLTTAIIGLLIIAASLIPAFIHLWHEKDNKVPFFPMVGLFYCLFFGLPVFTLPIAWPDPTNILIYKKHPLGEISNEALLIVFAGVSTMIVAFYITRFFVQTRISIFSLNGVANLKSARPLFWLVLVGYFLNEIHGNIMVLSSATQFLVPGSLLSIGGLILCWVEGYLHPYRKNYPRFDNPTVVFLLRFDTFFLSCISDTIPDFHLLATQDEKIYSNQYSLFRTFSLRIRHSASRSK